MLQFNSRQMETLGDDVDRRYLRGLKVRLRDQIPEPTETEPLDADGRHERLVRQIVERGEALGIEEAEDLLVFAVLALQARLACANDAALLEWIRTTLELDGVSGSGRIFLVLDGLRELGPANAHARELATRIRRVQEAAP